MTGRVELKEAASMSHLHAHGAWSKWPACHSRNGKYSNLCRDTLWNIITYLQTASKNSWCIDIATICIIYCCCTFVFIFTRSWSWSCFMLLGILDLMSLWLIFTSVCCFELRVWHSFYGCLFSPAPIDCSNMRFNLEIKHVCILEYTWYILVMLTILVKFKD